MAETQERLFEENPGNSGHVVTESNGQQPDCSAAQACEMNNVVQKKAETEISDCQLDGVEAIRYPTKLPQHLIFAILATRLSASTKTTSLSRAKYLLLRNSGGSHGERI